LAILAEVQYGIESIFQPGQLTELRLLLVDGKWVGFFFDDHDRLAAAICAMDVVPDTVRGIYYIFNPIKRSALESPRCNLYLNPGDQEMRNAILCPNKRMWPLTSNDDIETVEWAMVDIDPVRAEGYEHESATKEERHAAAALANNVIQFCQDKGCTDPLLASSGNGWHALYRVHLANTPESHALIAAFVRTLGFKFTDSKVAKVDQAVKNAARLTRAYGSSTRKGTNSYDRPWRMNKVQQKGSDAPCPVEVLKAIAAQASPMTAKAKGNNGLPELHEDFDADEFVEWVEEVWPVEADFEKSGVRFVVLQECLNAERRHRGDWKKSAFIIGKTLGYKCHSDDCEDFKIGAALSKLAQLHGEPYPGEIFAADFAEINWEEMESMEIDDPELASVEGIESAADLPQLQEPAPLPVAVQLPDAEPVIPSLAEDVQATETQTQKEEAEAQVKSADDMNLVEQLLALVFTNPKEVFHDFALYRSRLWWVVEQKAWHKEWKEVLRQLLAFEMENRRLPSKDEFLMHLRKSGDANSTGLVVGIGEMQEDLTIDWVCQSLIDKAQVLDEKRTAAAWVKKLGQTASAVEAIAERKFVKERWGAGIATNAKVVKGSVQEHHEQIYERYRRLVETDDNDPLAFKTLFPEIDDVIMSSEERFFGLAGPPNNFKTSIILTLVINMARQNKGVLMVTGEHDPALLEDRVALLHGYFMRQMFRLPAYKTWRDHKATPENLQDMRLCLDDLHALVSCPGAIDIKGMDYFNYELDEIVTYMENNQQKYQYKALVIDPFDMLLLNADEKFKFAAGSKLISKLLSLKTTYYNNSGLIILTSFQMKKAVKGKVEELQRDPDSTLLDFETELGASEIETFSAAVQKVDMLGRSSQEQTRQPWRHHLCPRSPWPAFRFILV
jgi:hypothetical protein